MMQALVVEFGTPAFQVPVVLKSPLETWADVEGLPREPHCA
jgi:hypothetical protein